MFGLFTYTEKKCAKEVIKALAQHRLPDTPYYAPTERQINCGDMHIYLGNIFNKACTLCPKDRKDYIEGFVANALEEYEFSYEDSAHLLIPRLKMKSEIELRKHYMHTQDNKSFPELTYPFTASFCLELGLDAERAIRIVSLDNLKKMQLSKPDALAIAKKNLFSVSQSSFQEIDEGIYISRHQDDHDAARILLDDEIRALKLNGDPVAFVPAAAVLILCGSQDFNAFRKIQLLMTDLSEGQRPLSFRPLILKETGWNDFDPPKIADYATIHNLITLEKMNAYGEQKNVLDKSPNDDFFIASFSVYEKDSTPFYQSVVTWSQDIPSWLPVADSIAMVKFKDDIPQPIGEIDFDKALIHLKDYLRPLGLDPERYEVVKFPCDEKLSEVL